MESTYGAEVEAHGLITGPYSHLNAGVAIDCIGTRRPVSSFLNSSLVSVAFLLSNCSSPPSEHVFGGIMWIM